LKSVIWEKALPPETYEISGYDMKPIEEEIEEIKIRPFWETFRKWPIYMKAASLNVSPREVYP